MNFNPLQADLDWGNMLKLPQHPQSGTTECL